MLVKDDLYKSSSSFHVRIGGESVEYRRYGENPEVGAEARPKVDMQRAVVNLCILDKIKSFKVS